jgi:hypothetical protein
MPELAYPRIRNTQEPASVFREIGASRVVYFPGDIDRTAWRSGNPDFTRLLGNSVRWLLGNRAAPLSVQGKGMMELFAWETEPGMAIHIVNYTNPNMTRPFVRELYPIGPLQIRVVIPKGKNISKVRALRSGRNLLFTREADVVQFEVSSVEDYEVIALI